VSRKRGDPALITNILDDPGRHATPIHHIQALHFHRRAADVAFLVYDLLQRVVFPAENVVAVVTVPGGVGERVDEWLTPVCGPERRGVEGRGFVDDFVHELWHAHGVGGWAGALAFKST
jgi:hypothetical protein